jgi:hypothetical protein
MNIKIILCSLLLFLSGLMIAGCTETKQITILPLDTPVPFPTNTRISTPIPTSTKTAPPTQTPSQTALPSPPREVPARDITLTGPITSPKSQISGMTWYADELIILPQYPEKNLAENGKPALYALPKKDILDYLGGSIPSSLTPSRITFDAADIASQIPGYEGYEAIAIEGDQVYLTVEANRNGTMQGYLINGTYLPEQNLIKLDPSSLTQIPVPVQIFNYAYETLLMAGNKALAIYEANGIELNQDPYAIAIDTATFATKVVDFDQIEYRITDATAIDENGQFWVLNIFMPIEFWLYTNSDPISEKYGEGKSHAENMNVERLLELQYNGDSITLAENEPVQIELIDEFNARNWEALVILDDKGFLVMTDSYPDTILAYIPFP